MHKCFICGRTERTTRNLVPFMNTLPDGAMEVLWICRHGHWDTVVTHAFTGAPIRLTGDYEDTEVEQ